MRVTIFGSKSEHNPASFEPARDIPSLADRVVLITGAAGDLGRVTATQLAKYGRPARIYVADLPPRDEGGREAVEGGNKTEIRFLDLDLGSFESVQQCAANFTSKEDRLDLMILNAGIIRVKPGVTKEGYESHFGINYVGHALLTRLLMPVMLRTAKQQQQQQGEGDTTTRRGRLVIVSSEGWAMAPKGGILFDKVKSDCADMGYLRRYGQSKLALIHLTKHLAKLHPEIDIVALHPGRVNTGMGTELGKESLLVRLTAPLAPFLSVDPDEGARNHLWTATSPNVVSGKYYEPVGVPDKEGATARDDEMKEALMQWTDNELKGVAAPPSE
ncbi:hypothetical protein M406DRAFT_51240 [Cryphonectria parasitica EP155]|uniref:NAD(P)-binding protein n=1 Tax=Cryphonectria parasitica (strain ATCC 38755 / EP155) TaxID=660469 RepID=A0A9P4XYY7_CRYP1|nr:uncharacterized protein M406DRAFT_51240 [Cryphonectria parasitica EP155]KAF3763899.1 hypothetical protein M406DRAFT_51240 [Cryphonectria parasitica EP155]